MILMNFQAGKAKEILLKGKNSKEGWK